MKEPNGLFNSSLEGNVSQAIDFAQDAQFDKGARKAFVREAGRR